jgi:hypothetical protein
MPRRSIIHLTIIAALGATLGILLTSGSSEQVQAGGYYPGSAVQGAAADGITATGVGHARVSRPRRKSDDTIRLAVAAAQRVAIPRAAKDARRRAEAVASAVGLSLGSVESAAETEDSYSAGDFGRFGPGRYCGVISRRIFGAGFNRFGGRVVRRVVRRKGCVVPRTAAIVLAVRYEKG